MDDRPGSRIFRDLMCELAVSFGIFDDVMTDVSEGFDLDSAAGVQLDAVGSVVGLPRNGYGDSDYHRFLDIQVNLLLSAARDDAEWTGTHENILAISRTFIGPAVLDPIVLINLPPQSFLLTVPNITAQDTAVLAAFLTSAVYAEVLGHMLIVLATNSLWDSASVAVPGGGTWGSASVVVASSAVWGTAITIG